MVLFGNSHYILIRHCLCQPYIRANTGFFTAIFMGELVESGEQQSLFVGLSSDLPVLKGDPDRGAGFLIDPEILAGFKPEQEGDNIARDCLQFRIVI